jgi:hypothetical protein
MDSAHIQNVPTMLKLKGGTARRPVAEHPADAGRGDRGRPQRGRRPQAGHAYAVQPAIAVLFQLLGFVVEAGKGVVRTSMDNLADQNPNAPVGTTLALIQEGMTVFSSIHARLHDAMGRTLRILHRLNAMYLDDEDVKHEVGEVLATARRLRRPDGRRACVRPAIFSEAQRYAQVQACAARRRTAATVQPAQGRGASA